MSHIGWFGYIILHLNFLFGFSDSVEKTLFLLIYRKCNFEGSYCPGKVKGSYKSFPILQSGSNSEVDGLLISRRKTGSKNGNRKSWSKDQDDSQVGGGAPEDGGRLAHTGEEARPPPQPLLAIHSALVLLLWF